MRHFKPVGVRACYELCSEICIGTQCFPKYLAMPLYGKGDKSLRRDSKGRKCLKNRNWPSRTFITGSSPDTPDTTTQKGKIKMSRPVKTIAGGPRSHVSAEALDKAFASDKALASSGSGQVAVAGAPLAQNATSWSLLYGALINGLGLSAQNFQLIYPMMSWDWPTNNVGFTNAPQYDFCATIPQWSAVGAYISSGATFDSAYQQFLNTISLKTTNLQLQNQIDDAEDQLTQAAGKLQITSAQAEATYNKSVTNNDPTFTEWLASPAGLGYGSQIESQTKIMKQAQAVLDELVTQQDTPNISDALDAMNSDIYRTSLVDPNLPNLSSFPAVPSYSISKTSKQWTSQVQSGVGTGGSLSFSNSNEGYDYSNTWAQTSASMGGWFWSVYDNGSWEQVTQFSTDSSLTCTISFAAWDIISITPSKWYSGVSAFKNGPFKDGYTSFSQPGSKAYMFGEGGIVPCLKTGMLVGYQPTVVINVNMSTFNSFAQQWSTATGIQVGPFQFGGSGGGSQLKWTTNQSGMSLNMTSTSNVPLIFGVTVDVLP